MGHGTITSASGIISLLDEEQDEVKEFALTKLNEFVNEFWAEIAAHISKIELLSEDESFRSRSLAALVASKVYYHLEEFSEAMTFALGAGKLFDVSQHSEYVDTVVAKCIDEYIRLRNEQTESKDPHSIKIDKRLEDIVLGMFERCFRDKQYKQALGIAIETRRLDKIEQAIAGSDDVQGLLIYCQNVCMTLIENRDFRQTVLRLLVKIYQSVKSPDYLRVCQMLVFLDDSKSVADILTSLLKTDSEDDTLLAFQIGFDLVNNATQQFLLNVRNLLPQPPAQQQQEEKSKDSMEVEKTSESPESAYFKQVEKLLTILSGETSIGLQLDFLFRNNRTDLLLLKNIKTAVEQRTSLLHTATIFANALMHAGTTNDIFLRDNLDWLRRATNWAKFSAIAGLGVIHKGQVKEALSVLSSYLPQRGVSGSAYSEGGSLYGLGLIHANHGTKIIDYLLQALSNASSNEIVQHGASLGLGVAAMATGRDDIYEVLKEVLYVDSAIAGEAAGLAMGLVMLGTANKKAIDEMLIYAHETQHEKIIRGLAVGLSLVMYGREEEADTIIEQLLLDKDPILRYGAMYTIGMAYAGTANNTGIRRLLHVAVSDVSDDVRRAAVTALGFILINRPEQCPKVVSLLAESYNPHVRYGACLALGISCAGTGLREAIDLLEPLLSDSVDFVRQGALISMAMLIMQQTKAQYSKIEQIRKLLDEKITDKHEDTMCKFGAILATGILEGGGRNVTLGLRSRSGHNNMTAIVGMCIFTQFWYWYPLVYFVSLAFTPTAFIGLTKDLKMPVYKFKSNAKPSLFAYPPETKPPEVVAPTKVQSAVLSVTNKKQQREKSKKKEDLGLSSSSASAVPEAMDVEEKEKEEKQKEEKQKEEKKKEEPEADFEIKQNPARVTPQQVKHISFDVEGQRYKPIREAEAWGIVLLKNYDPSSPEDFVTPATAPSSSQAQADEGEEPNPPQPFTYDPALE